MMIDYFQPEFYKFNSDSICLIREVVEKVKHAHSVLDLGAGCGILGIEIANKIMPGNLTLLDCQIIWRSYLQKNVELFLNKSIEHQLIFQTFGDWNPDMHYDLIVCNPPYFLPGHGKESPNRHRDIARRFIQDSWEILLQTIIRCLAPDGRAFFVVKENQIIIKKIENFENKLILKKNIKQGLALIELVHKGR